ncbi:MAG: rubredoxin [Oscillospiraceae bacterium]|nr:rubredoxin [Oscillospiraceae bacterium]
MGKYACSVCGYVYDESAGIPETGIAPGTKWEALPDDWVCPVCGATKSEFEKQGETAAPSEKQPKPAAKIPDDMRELSPLEISGLCTNLARGCEKQYKPEEAALFMELAVYFGSVSAPAKDPNFNRLLELVEKDLEVDIPAANSAAAGAKDRGALRALVWGEKVTRILKSLLTRYLKEGDAMLENTGVYVCTICGFIFIGNKLPEVCPVCKVPNWKFEKVEGR